MRKTHTRILLELVHDSEIDNHVHKGTLFMTLGSSFGILSDRGDLPLLLRWGRRLSAFPAMKILPSGMESLLRPKGSLPQGTTPSCTAARLTR